MNGGIRESTGSYEAIYANKRVKLNANHFNVTEHPTPESTAQQIIEAFPEDLTPRYLIRDRDGVYGSHFRNRLQGMGIKEVLTAAQSPWQNPFAERLIGSVRRECLNHVIVMGEHHLK